MEFVDAIKELRELPEGTHLLCPRQNDDDHQRYDELEQVDTQGRKIKDLVAEANTRREKFLSCMRILAYNADGVEELQSWVLNKLDDTLEKCDFCVKQYYMGKTWLMDQLKMNYEEEDIVAFFQRVDELDIKRITRNLATATAQLKSVPPEKIALSVLERAALLSIFETLSCEAMLRNESLLAEHFDVPFRLVQTKRTLKISDYVPAVTRFLFDANQLRSFWAISTWTRYARPPTASEFDWAIRDGLLGALQIASVQPPQLTSIQRLWRGMQLIVRKLDKEQITHQLRALDIDPIRLSVDHLSFPTPGLRFLLNTIQTFLEKAPTDFWDAMQTISPQAIMEHTFFNTQFNAFLMQTTEGDPYEKSAMKDMLSWIEPFLDSLKPAHSPAASRFLALQLLNRLQSSQLPQLSRYHCFRIGLNTLLHTLRRFTDNEASRSSVDHIVLETLMGVLSDIINIILNTPKFDIEEGRQQEIVSSCMDVVRNALALECQSLKSDYEVLLTSGSLSHRSSTYSPPIWNAVLKHLNEDNPGLSAAALLGIIPLVGLEKFPVKGEESQKITFNETYEHLTRLSSQIIENLAEFKPDHLETLFKTQDTSSALISTLFTADIPAYQASVDLIKNVSGKPARRDAISYLLERNFTTTMYGLSWSFRRISNMKTFGPAPRMLHTGTDIIEILAGAAEALGLLWQALTTIFNETENWSLRGNDKSKMLEFCRDTIQFADFLFNQYAVFLGALESSVKDADPSQKSASENFLRSPTSIMRAMVKWLRLKDEYLATTTVGLVSKVLRRLASLDVTTVQQDALDYIEGVSVNGTIRTILTAPDKAELVRSLEAYYKKPVVTASTAALKKQSSITAFAKPSDTHPSRSFTSSDDEFTDVPNDTLLELSHSVELNRQRLATQAKQKAEQARKSTSMATKSRQTISQQIATQRVKDNVVAVSSFRERREREKEAKKKRDLEAAARLRKNLPARGVAEQTPEQGSGLKGIGVKGKDHNVQANSMMVSSGSESDSESEDELDQELFGAKPKKSEAVAAYEESKKKALQQQPVRKAKRARSANDMRARLTPDLSNLQHTILSWDYFATGNYPPSSGKWDCTAVSNTYRHCTEYQATFEPLLVLEAWQGFQQVKEEGSFRSFEFQVMSRMTIDNWIEVCIKPVQILPKDLHMGEGDIILFSNSSQPTSDPKADHVLARVAKVTHTRGKEEIVCRLNGATGANAATSKFLASFAPKFEAWGAKITSFTPVEREYGALMALQFYDLCHEILQAKPSPILTYGEAKLDPFMKTYSVNRAQAIAIRHTLDNDGFTLIQGPPGSGKTKTITALVGSLLSGVLGKTATSIKPGSHAPSSRPGPPVIGGPPAKPRGKLLICAPSNAAVDELVMRLKQGVTTRNGSREKISVVRMGRGDAINSKVLEVSLDELVNARLAANPSSNGAVDMQKLYEQHKETDTRFKEIRSSLDELRAQGRHPPEELEREYDLMRRKRSQLSTDIDKARDKIRASARNADLDKQRVQKAVIDEAHVICATLSGSGHEIFQKMNVEFETVIIDEAAQSIELSALIPLKYGCSKCILVGDPKQLPPTVLSQMATSFQYEQSLFVRMQKNHPKDVHLLDVQYRMHPAISQFPSATFYDGRLQDGPGMVKLRQRPWHQSKLLSPYRFFDVQGMHQSAPKGHSLVNYAEIRVSMQLYDRLIADVKDYDFAGNIGIITPYKGQLKEMKMQFIHRYGEQILKQVDFNTTDAFQGRECEVIIFSCVRASNKGIGFLADIRRMNVGLTRAKSSLWVLGNSQALMQGKFWGSLIKDARGRNVYTDGDILKLLQQPQVTPGQPLLDVTQEVETVKQSSPPPKPESPPAPSKKAESPAPYKKDKSPSRSASSSDQGSPQKSASRSPSSGREDTPKGGPRGSSPRASSLRRV
ncbi:hypothetical protein N7532_002860 [Penicillium argentinense]|uniref:SEN1 N terminal-domain-containing protein n=1 Tax=Penicillium argentinense TaxID=1131581 RepID=A0A9W9G169_9EURO|nr:uncharacterized protein N7532_002860 [Penicillium argentinense]KAJ5110215.1 hypothetical protein N7532_002860 [Penicillium argentinense]